jgi:hypothetical protein
MFWTFPENRANTRNIVPLQKVYPRQGDMRTPQMESKDNISNRA